MKSNDSKFNRIHAICAYTKTMRDDKKPCQQCPAWTKDQRYGKMQKFCYGMAKEISNIAKYGNPWGKKTPRAARVRWQKRCNNT